jgi:hypothetical protein
LMTMAFTKFSTITKLPGGRVLIALPPLLI